MEYDKEIEMRRLIIKSFHITKVEFDDEFSINSRILNIQPNYFNEKLDDNKYLEKIDVHIIKPHEHNMFVNSIMDIIPISTKVLGVIGEGITHTITGVYIMMTGADKNGVQMAEFGSSEGVLKEKLYLGRTGTPGENDYIIHVDITFKEGLMSNRMYPTEGHRLCDSFIQEVRNILKKISVREFDEKHEYYDKIKPGKKKVAIVKQIAGQGTMYDNQLFSNEPSGFMGGKSIIDMKNLPIVLSPNEYRDGALRAMV